MDETISVIIPVYNVETYLCECVDSILSQSYTKLEILLIDDGSTDRSGEICDAYAVKDSRIRVIHQKNGGLSAARNTGLENTTGDYIYFIDSDDYLKPDAMRKLLEKAVNDCCDMVFFDASSFDDDGEQPQQRYRRTHSYPDASGIAVFERQIRNREFHSSVCNCFFKRNFLTENHLSFVCGIYYEDMIFTYQVFLTAKKVGYIPEALYMRRYRSGSIMKSQKTPKYFESAAAVSRAVYEIAQSSNYSENFAVKAYIVRCAANGINNYRAMSKADRKRCKADFQAFTDEILSHNAYGDKALKYKCHSEFAWFLYKCTEKFFHRKKGEVNV